MSTPEQASSLEQLAQSAPVWVRVQSVGPGIHNATVSNIRLALGAYSGNEMYVWTFTLDSGPQVSTFNSTRGKGAADNFRIVRALGLSQEFSHAEAVGRACRLDIAVNKAGYPEVRRVLSAGGPGPDRSHKPV